MSDVTFSSDLTVKLIDSMGNDASFLAAMLVSTQGEDAQAVLDEDPEAGRGRLNFLMREKHGCFDDKTEVLTADGWKFWPEVDGTESFLTLNLSDDTMEYQRAERLVRRPANGPMIRIKLAHVDALVTPDHNMVAAPRVSSSEQAYGLYPALDFLDRSHRVRLGGGEWTGDLTCPDAAELVGFIAADGNFTGTSVTFHLYKETKIDHLRRMAFAAGASVTEGLDGRFTLSGLSEEIRGWAKDTYTEDGDRQMPRELLLRGDQGTLTALLDGYLTGDGSVTALGKVTASTVSHKMVDDLQELALKAGLAAVEIQPDTERSGAFGSAPLFRLTFYRERNMQPRVGWTTDARSEQVQIVEDYESDVHCVTVPNGTLYVRRNGKPMWCGNTPFEHAGLTVYVKAPIMVYREWHRHRIGMSYNEESGRYSVLKPEFYVPPAHRPLVQVGKPGAYQFVPGTPDQYDIVCDELETNSEAAYVRYQNLLLRGVAKEVARMTLPVNIYSSMYCTLNPRSLMAFLQLRTRHPDATFPSGPQWEIEQCALQLEKIATELWPLTMDLFRKNGSVCP